MQILSPSAFETVPIVRRYRDRRDVVPITITLMHINAPCNHLIERRNKEQINKVRTTWIEAHWRNTLRIADTWFKSVG